MPKPAKIVLYEPDLTSPRKHFSISIKQALIYERRATFQPRDTLVISGKGHDFYSFTHRLIETGIIDDRYRWAARDLNLVILGYLSHCPRSMWLIYGLEERASRREGMLHYLPEENSHRQMSSWLRETPDYDYSYKSKLGYTAIMYDGHRELIRWLDTKKNTITIGDKTFTTKSSVIACNDIITPDSDQISEGLFIAKENMKSE